MPRLLKHVPKWIHLSVLEHIKTQCPGVIIFSEHLNTRNIDRGQDHIEIRIDGPNTTEYTRGDFSSYIEVNVGINVRYNERDTTRFSSLMGLVTDALWKDICCFRYGNDPTYDTKAFFETLVRDDMVQGSYFGQVDPNIEIQQGTCETHYLMRWKDNGSN